MSQLEDQVALVTGGGSGLGAAIVDRFVEEGCAVGVLERSHDKAQALRERYGAEVVVTEGDATTWEGNRRAVEAVRDAFGKLDVFVGNAGLWDYHTPLEAYGASDLSAAFDEVFGLNVKGQLLGVRAGLEELRASRGAVILTLSNAAFGAGGGGPLYTASKHALVGIVKQLAYELAPEVRVNGVAPGGMKTDLRGPRALGLEDRSLLDSPVEEMMAEHLPLRIACRPSDYAGYYVLLASRRDGRATTGSIHVCEGGLLTGSMRERHRARGAAPERDLGHLHGGT